MALFLALRHVARRPGGVRTTIVLATAFALAAFAVSAWSVGRDNEQRVAAVEVGAPTVLTVGVPAGQDLGTIVAKADPGGRMAAAVDSYTSLSSGTAGLTTLAVDPQRFARVASWQPGLTKEPLAALAAKLAPRTPRPTILTGDAVRVTVAVHALSPAGSLIAADVTTGSSPVSLGALPTHGTATLTGQLTGCPCVLQDLDVSPPTGSLQSPVSGVVTITGLHVHNSSGWVPAGPASTLSDASHWRAGHADDPPDRIQASATGMTWQFNGRPRQDAILTSVNRPYPLPALVSAALVGPGQTLATGTGLDGKPQDLRVISTAAAVPGAPQNGVIVDRQYAELAAGENFPDASQQVWLAGGAQDLLESRLKAAGVQVLSARSTASTAAVFARQGPALASVLFLADAAAAALLAAGAAILGLYLSARRRRYEYAALSASGVPHPVAAPLGAHRAVPGPGVRLPDRDRHRVDRGGGRAAQRPRIPHQPARPCTVLRAVTSPAGGAAGRGRRAAGHRGGDGQRHAYPLSQPRPATGNSRHDRRHGALRGPGPGVRGARRGSHRPARRRPHGRSREHASPCSAPPGPGNPPCCGCSPGC